jgi:hypothetical protein
VHRSLRQSRQRGPACTPAAITRERSLRRREFRNRTDGAGQYTHADRHADTNADAHTHADRHADTNTDTDAHTHANRHTDTDTDAHADTNADTNADTDAQTDRHADTNADTDAHTHANCHVNPNADAHAHAECADDTSRLPDPDVAADPYSPGSSVGTASADRPAAIGHPPVRIGTSRPRDASPPRVTAATGSADWRDETIGTLRTAFRPGDGDGCSRADPEESASLRGRGKDETLRPLLGRSRGSASRTIASSDATVSRSRAPSR